MEDKKWYQGFGNILTLFSFITFIWPVSVIVMWLFADWSRKAKKLITLVVLSPFFVYMFGYYASHPNFGINPYKFVPPLGFTLRYSAIVVPLGLLLILLYYIYVNIEERRSLNKKLAAWILWFIYGVVLTDVFILGFLYNIVRW